MHIYYLYIQNINGRITLLSPEKSWLLGRIILRNPEWISDKTRYEVIYGCFFDWQCRMEKPKTTARDGMLNKDLTTVDIST